jgi:NADPH:quinone reductase-like Zn-dependent oxidoreductase
MPPRCEAFAEPVAGEGEVIVHVHAAALSPATKAIASGTHYSSPVALPVVCGLDGVGHLDDGTRVFFGGPRSPFGTMAERTVVPRGRCWPIPEGVDDVTAAALPNPAMSSWLPFTWGVRLAPGETVLILGATGVAGKLAVQIAKLLGAGRVVAAGRNETVLSTLHELGADTTIRLGLPDHDLVETFAREAGETGYDVIIDYLWGRPTEALLTAMTRSEISFEASGPRLVQVGNSAGPAISLTAAAVRSVGLTILGGGFPPLEVFVEALRQLMARAASGELQIATEEVPLAQTEEAWKREDNNGRRLVIRP